MRSRPVHELTGPESAYLVARLLICLSVVVLYAGRVIVLPLEPGIKLMFDAALGLFTLTTAGCVVALLVFSVPTDTVLWVALPFDLLSGSMFIVSSHTYSDPIYTWFVGVVIVYAVVLRRRQSDAVSVLVAVTYLVGHYVARSGGQPAGDYVLMAFKAVALILIGYFVSDLTFRQRAREAELEASRDDIEDLNDRLQRRLGELNAVSEITDVVHSSLEFDAIGPIVLQIIERVTAVSACSLLVLDKEKAETLFSASTGMGALPPRQVFDPEDGRALSLDGGEFACTTIYDQARMMVVFCAPSDEIGEMAPEDRYILQAVASELAVAVENSQLYKLTKRLSITDELTGLHNYRHMQQRLEDEFERARRYERSLSLLMLDADEFKRFNDLHGHVAGDRALADVGTVLRTVVREIDVPARYGGEEFAIILPETDAAGAFVVAEKVREAIGSHEFADEDGMRGVHLSVSIGLASYPLHAGDKEALLRQADEALYQAKRLGRDQVRVATATVRPLEEPPDTLSVLSDDDIEEQPA